jgi:hypothetical protein
MPTETIPSTETDEETQTETEQTQTPEAPTPRPATPSRPQTTPRTPTKPTPKEPEPEPQSLDEALDLLRQREQKIANLTQEKERHRATADKFRELTEQKQKEEEAKLGEQERVNRKIAKLEDEGRGHTATIATLQNELANTLIDHEIEREALRLSFANPEHAPRLVDRDKIEFDPETRKVTGAKAALEKFLKDYPDYAGTSARGGTGPSRAPANGSGARTPSKKAIDPYEQELAEMGRGGRM